MPGEWHPHEATWLSWPNNVDTWTEQMDVVENAYVQFIQSLTPGEKVKLLVDSPTEKKRVEFILSKHNALNPNVILLEVPTVDVWIRDYGPNFVLKGKEVGWNRWHFNAWGNKYADLAKDDIVPDLLDKKKLLPAQRFETGLVMEGGSIDVNGAGVCLTTEQCLLAPTRNPSLNKAQIENELKKRLGVSKVIWLGEGIEGDDTDGHVDDISRFVAPDTIVTAYEDDPKDFNHEPLHHNYEKLCRETDANGKPFKILKLPMPGRVDYEGRRLPASYANFYIGNASVVVPIFGHKNDQKALTILDSVFPDRKVVGIDCRIFVRGLGTLHCASQQEPKGA